MTSTIQSMGLVEYWQCDPRKCPDYYLREWNVRGMGRRNCLNGPAQLVAKAFPDWNKAAHKAAAQWHTAQANALQVAHLEVAKACALITWGRELEATDYRISGIYSHEFPQALQDCLRDMAARMSAHRHLAHSHNAARILLK